MSLRENALPPLCLFVLFVVKSFHFLAHPIRSIRFARSPSLHKFPPYQGWLGGILFSLNESPNTIH
jgi:hypothetical protein